MKIALLSLSILLLQNIAQAQPLAWAKQIISNVEKSAQALAVDHAGNIIAGGTFKSTLTFDPGENQIQSQTALGTFDIFISKWDPSGRVLWVSEFDGYSNGFLELGKIDIDSENNIYASGIFHSNLKLKPGDDNFTLPGGDGGANIFICKMNSSGEVVMGMEIKSLSGRFEKAQVALAPNGDFIIASFISGKIDVDPGPGVTEVDAADGKICVFSISASGEFKWVTQFGIGLALGFIDFYVDSKGNPVIGGYFYNKVNFGTLAEPYMLGEFSSSGFVAKINGTEGKLDWIKPVSNYGGGAFFGHIALDKEDNVYRGNFLGDSLYTGDEEVHLRRIKSDASTYGVVKFDENGNVADAWPLAATIGGSGAGALFIGKNGNFYTGLRNSGVISWPLADGQWHEISAAGATNSYLTTHNSNGDFQGAHAISGELTNLIQFVVADDWGNVYALGNFLKETHFGNGITYTSYSTDILSANIFLMRLGDADPQVNMAKSLPDNNEFSVFPNPASGLLFINAGSTQKDVEMRDITGKLMLQTKLENSSGTLDVSHLAPGIYLLSLSDETGRSTKKVLIN